MNNEYKRLRDKMFMAMSRNRFSSFLATLDTNEQQAIFDIIRFYLLKYGVK